MTVTPGPASRRIGEEPRPRALLSWNGPHHDRIAEVLALHAPTIREITHVVQVRQADYDLLITNQMGTLIAGAGTPGPLPAGHLLVVSFSPGGVQGWTGIDSLTGGAVSVRARSPHLAKGIDVPDDLPDAVHDLVEDDLIPAALAAAATTRTSRSRCISEPGRRTALHRCARSS
jgi:hypothetical protein